MIDEFNTILLFIIVLEILILRLKHDPKLTKNNLRIPGLEATDGGDLDIPAMLRG
jgi:hypothetical protein